jgi:hypothetical protein
MNSCESRPAGDPARSGAGCRAVRRAPCWGSGLRFCPVREGVGDESGEQGLRRQAELGRLLAAAESYQVVAGDGARLGWLDHVRYERHADRPDEIVVRRRGVLPRRRRAVPFWAVEAVRPRERTVVLRLDRGAFERAPSA